MSERERFPVYRCPECDELYGRPPAACRECGSERFDDETLPGLGHLYASTVIRVPGSDRQGQEPFVVGLVDVGDNETVRVTARIEGERRLRPDTTVAFVESRDGTYVFTPRDSE